MTRCRTSLAEMVTSKREYRIVATCRIGHHSEFSGYEQLMKYVEADEKIVSRRGPPQSVAAKWVERALRMVSISRWYQMDGFEAEWAAIRARVKTGRPVMLHYLYGDGALGVLPYLARLLGIRLIVTVHACPSDIPNIYRKSRALRSVSCFVLLGSNQSIALEKLGVSPNQMVIVPHGVDTDAFSESTPEKRQEFFSILLVGNWRRNIGLYKEILDRAVGVNNLRFTLVSRQPVADSLKNCKNLKVHQNISDDELIRLYLSSNCLLFAAEDAVANNVLLEALAAGLPIVAEDVGAVREYVGKNHRFLFKTNDATAALDMIRELEDDRELADEVATEAIRRSKLFSWSEIAKSILEVYSGDDACPSVPVQKTLPERF